MHKVLVVAFAVLAAVVAPATAHAQAWPAKPIRVIVPYPPGGPMDPLMRLLQEPLGASLGQSVVVENRPGATGSLGMNVVAQSAPDGYNFTVATSDGILIIPRIKKDLPYDVERDFTPVTQMVYTTTILVTNPKSPFNDFRELLAYAKANPGKLNLGSFGMGGGTHQLLELINKRGNVRIVHVPYKGSGPAVQAAVAGEVDLAASTPQVVGPFIRGGKLKGLAITTEKRNADFPDIASYKEQGYDISNAGWFGLFGPGKLPRDITDRMAREVGRIINQPAQRKFLTAAFGTDPVGSMPDEFARFLKAEGPRADELAELLRAAGYKGD
jgi:tripartite-type tricarboxylate transporter receptor subunit TctC